MHYILCDCTLGRSLLPYSVYSASMQISCTLQTGYSTINTYSSKVGLLCYYSLHVRYQKPLLLYACVCHTLQLRTSLSVEHFKVFVTWRLPLGRCGHSSSVIHSWLCFSIPRGTTLDTDKFYCAVGWVRGQFKSPVIIRSWSWFGVSCVVSDCLLTTCIFNKYGT